MKHKNLTIVLLLFFTMLNAYTQDYITFPNGTFIKVKIIEIGSLEIKYKPYNNSNDQLFTVPRNQVYNVRYENGVIDFLNGNKVMPNQSSNLTNVETFKSPAAAIAQTPVSVAKTPTVKQGNSTLATNKATSTATSKQASLSADLSTQLNLTPEQILTLKAILDSNAAATTAATAQQTNYQTTATQSTYSASVPIAEQAVAPAQVNQYAAIQTANSGDAPVNGLTPMLTSTLVNQGLATLKPKRPTAFRDYGGYVNFNGVSSAYSNYGYDASSFLGFSSLLEGKIGRSDFGFGIDASYLSTIYEMNKYDMSSDIANEYIDIGVRLSYHLPITTYFDPYIAVRTFYYFDADSLDEDVDADFILGARFMYKSVGFVYEFHTNYEYSMFGISFSIK